MSPNLFKIFINDLPSYLESTPDPVHLNNIDLHCLMYADDLVILSESATGLQANLGKLQSFCDDWCLTININKTKVMVFNKAGRLVKGKFEIHNTELRILNVFLNIDTWVYTFRHQDPFHAPKQNFIKRGLKLFINYVEMF